MSRPLRALLLMLGAASALLAALSGGATASTWQNTGNLTHTATAGVMSLSVAGTGTITCASQVMTGVTGTSSGAATWLAATNGTITGASCRNGLTAVAVRCGYRFDALSLASGVVTANLLMSPAPGCSVTQGAGASICSIDGTIGITYRNPGVAASAGVYAIPANTSLTAHNGTNGPCPLGDGTTVSMAAELLPVVNGSLGGGTAPRFGPFFNHF